MLVPTMRTVLVTGGAGFMGSHLVERLLSENLRVVVLDNLSSGKISNLPTSSKISFVEGDCTDPKAVDKALSDIDTIFHFAANPEIRTALQNSEDCYRNNLYATYVILERLRNKPIEKFVFASTSTVYGDAKVLPTPEDYGLLEPISIYGACKLATEALISSYAHSFGFKAILLRLANIVGGRSRHGVIYDFTTKLTKNGRELEILGDGKQIKSYLDVQDCVDAIMQATKTSTAQVGIYNVGSEDQITVKKIVDIVCEEMNLNDVVYKFTGGVDGGRGWVGDVKNMLLDITKLKASGWRPKMNSSQALRKAAREVLQDLKTHASVKAQT